MSESGSLYGMLLSLAGSGQGIEQNNANIDAALSAQAIENERTREHNLRLAEKQNQWNLDMWNRQNAYNSPEQQVARLRAAGLNPDMMMGGGISNTSTSSPQMTSGAAATPMDWSALANKRTIGDTIQQSLQNQLTQAQIDNINADTKNKGHEGSILASDASFRNAWNQGQLDTMYSNITLNNVKGDLSLQQIKESQARIREIDSTVQKIGVEIDSIRNAMANDNARLNLEKVFNSANIERLASASHLDKVTANKISSELEKILRQYDDNHDIANEQKIILGRDSFIKLQQGKEAEFNARINTYEGYTSDMNFYQNCNKFILQLVNMASDLIPFAGQ